MGRGGGWNELSMLAVAQGIIYDKGPQLLPLTYSRPCSDAIISLLYFQTRHQKSLSFPRQHEPKISNYTSYITDQYSIPRLCSSRAQWPVAPKFCSRVTTRKSLLFHRNHMLGTLDFTSSEHWAPFSFSQSTALHTMSTVTLFQNKSL